ncbi:MAG TPA: hypothetical protein DDX01_07400, partial [Holosporales bacterium]|nr:hypothetical protein [Holosporales bacterium]
GGKSRGTIAKILGVHKSTISRELKRNKDPDIGTYLPDKAQILAQQRRGCPGSKIERSKPLQILLRLLQRVRMAKLRM